MDPLQNGLSMLFKKKNKTSVENSIAVVGVTKALLIGKKNSWYCDGDDNNLKGSIGDDGGDRY